MITKIKQIRFLLLLMFLFTQVCAYGENLHLEENSFDLTDAFLQVVFFLTSLPMGLISLATCVYLFMLIFMRQRLYAKIDNYAGIKVTPDGFFSKIQLQGIVPLGLLALLTSFAMTFLVAMKTSVAGGLLALGTEVLAFVVFFLYCRWWVRRKSDTMPTRAAKATLFFAIMSICALIAIIIIAIYVVIIALMIVLGLFLVNVALNSMANSGSSSDSSSSSSEGVCRRCKYYDGLQCGRTGSRSVHDDYSCIFFER